MPPPTRSRITASVSASLRAADASGATEGRCYPPAVRTQGRASWGTLTACEQAGASRGRERAGRQRMSILSPRKIWLIPKLCRHALPESRQRRLRRPGPERNGDLVGGSRHRKGNGERLLSQGTSGVDALQGAHIRRPYGETRSGLSQVRCPANRFACGCPLMPACRQDSLSS